jgi:hypothetical protein
MTQTTMEDLYRVCAKVYAPEPEGITDDAAVFVPIFHEWIREQALDLVMIDVADYAHVPDSPGIMLVAHEASFALDRGDGRFGLLVQRRTPIEGDGVAAIARTVRLAIRAAVKLQNDARIGGRLEFDTSVVRVESNDRLRAPNTDEGFQLLEPLARQALAKVFPGRTVAGVRRVRNDPRDRLALEVVLEGTGDIREDLAA